MYYYSEMSVFSFEMNMVQIEKCLSFIYNHKYSLFRDLKALSSTVKKNTYRESVHEVIQMFVNLQTSIVPQEIY